MYLIANFKQNLFIDDYKDYVSGFSNLLKNFPLSNSLQLVFCPPLPYLYIFKDLVSSAENLHLGCQAVSEYSGGSNTGEVSAKQLSDFCSYTIIGHSEQRAKNEKNYNKMVQECLDNNIIPVVCVSDINELKNVNKNSNILYAYEPKEYIGKDEPAPISVVQSFYTESGLNSFIYGGSINDQNFVEFAKKSYINGFLVGRASLNYENFFNLAKSLQGILK